MNDQGVEMMKTLAAHGTPDELLDAIDNMNSPLATEAAFACLEMQAWEHLELMKSCGFDVSANLPCKDIKETLLHRTIRLHKYDDPARHFSALLKMGADPRRENSQGLTVLGMLCMHSRDMPAHRTKSALEVLLGSVRITESCGKEGLAEEDLAGPDAISILAKCCPELLPWAQALHLQETTPPNNLLLSRPRF